MSAASQSGAPGPFPLEGAEITPERPYRGDRDSPGSSTIGYDEARDVVVDELHEFVPLYSALLLAEEKRYQESDLEEEEFLQEYLEELEGDRGYESLWDREHHGRAKPLCVLEDVSMENVYRLFESQMEAEDYSTREILGEAVSVDRRTAAQLVAGAAGTVAGGYVALENGQVEALEPVEHFLTPLVDGFDRFDRAIAVSSLLAFLDGAARAAENFDPEKEVQKMLEYKEDALDHLYFVDVEYHLRDLGELDRIAQEEGADALPIPEGGLEMMKKRMEEDSEARLLYMVWDPTEERRMLKDVLENNFEDQGDPQAVYNRTFSRAASETASHS